MASAACRGDAQLASGAYDLSVGGAGWLRRVASRETLFNEPYVSVARRDHPRLSATVTLAEFLSERHVLISLHRQVSGVVDSALSKIGQSRTVGLTVPSFLLAPSAVAGSDMILTVGQRIAEAFADALDLRIFPTPIAVKPYRVPMASHVRTAGDPAVEWLMEAIRTFTREFAGPVP